MDLAWLDVKDYIKNCFPILNHATGLMPKPGVIYQYAGHSAPDGFLMCDGSAVSRTMYPELFAVIGTTYGTGDGSTTFNVPDLRGRVGIGVGDAYSLGNVGGEKEHGHTHGDLRAAIGAAEGDPASINYIATSAMNPVTGTGGGVGTYAINGSASTGRNFSHWTPVVGYTADSSSMQPYTVINYIISTGQGGVDTAEILGGMSQLPLSIANGGTGAVSKETALQGFGVEDYIIAKGTSGLWTWEKWNSGIAKCWLRDYASAYINVGWGSWYYGSKIFGTYKYPFTFIETPVETCNICVAGNSIVIGTQYVNTLTDTAAYYAVRPNSSNVLSDHVCCISVIGRWK